MRVRNPDRSSLRIQGEHWEERRRVRLDRGAAAHPDGLQTPRVTGRPAAAGPAREGKLRIKGREKIFGQKLHGLRREVFDNASFGLD
jgi:hypothetical protein